MFVNLAGNETGTPEPLGEFLGRTGGAGCAAGAGMAAFLRGASYTLNCNWKVYVDNYLDGGYHVPHLHKGLNSVLDYKHYTIENRRALLAAVEPDGEFAGGELVRGDADRRSGLVLLALSQFHDQRVRGRDGHEPGAAAGDGPLPGGVRFLFWRMCQEDARAYNDASVATSEKVQDEDVGICESVQKGLGSRAYGAGRLSVRREAGEHLFHRLLAGDLKKNRDQGPGNGGVKR